MNRLSRHTVVVLVVALLACVAGMSLAVVAFGQSGANSDAGVPAGDFTGTTPPVTSRYTVTTPPVTSGYTVTTPASTTPTTTPSTTPEVSGPTTAQGGKNPGPTRSSGGSTPSGPIPSRVTRPGPTHLAFTGGEPLLIGGLGIALMLGGLSLAVHRRRQAAG